MHFLEWQQANRGKVLVGWLVFFGLMAGFAGTLKDSLKVGGFSIPGTQFDRASRVLTRDFGMSSEKTLIAVYRSRDLKASEQGFADAVNGSLARLKTHPTVEKIESFYNTGIPDLVSADNHTTYALVALKGTEEVLERATPEYRKLATLSEGPVESAISGQPVANFDIESISSADIAHVDMFTFPLIFAVLTFLLGSWAGGAIPLGAGILSVVIALGGVSILSKFMPVSVFAMNIATMIGLGLSIDFTLILICRLQEELEHHDLQEAVTRAMERSGRSVFFSGFTLLATVSILTLFPIMIIRSIAQAIVIATVAAIFVFYGLMPLILRKWGGKLKRAARPKRQSFWLKLTDKSIRNPWLASAICLAILGALAAPTLTMRKIGTTLDVLPKHVESRQAVTRVREAFGDGASAPLFLVLHTARPDGIWQPTVLRSVYQIYDQLRHDPRVDKVQSLMSLIPNPSQTWAESLSKEGIASVGDLKRIAQRFVNLDRPTQSTYLIIFPKYAETHPETIALLESIRAQLPQWTAQAVGLQADLGGTPAQHYDFDQAVYQEAPPLVLVSLWVTFFVLFVFFRSVVLPIKAVLMNLLSLLASFGVMTLVFQYGFGASLLGFESLGGVQVYTPVLLFSILFGLSTDYEVFVLSRVKEFHDAGYSTAEATYLGIEKSSRVIAAAATVMVLVFFSFAFSSIVAVKEIGLSLAVAVLLDATLVRMVLVPASMTLMQRLNWWIPKFFLRILPEVAD